MHFLSMFDLDLKKKRVLIREDFNVPIKNNKIVSDARLRAALPTIQKVIDVGAKVILVSHLGRPQEGNFNADFSLQPVFEWLANHLKVKVSLMQQWQDIEKSGFDDSVVLLENIRFQVGEKRNSEHLAKKLASLCDIFIMDAFGAAHREHASTYGVAKYAPISCLGPLFHREIIELKKALQKPKKPMCAIVGGSKLSTKLQVIKSLAKLCGQIIVGGGIANTFIAAQGYSVGNSLYEKSFLEEAKKIMTQVHIIIPIDVICAKELSENTNSYIKKIDKVEQDDMILDMGPVTQSLFSKIIGDAKTILWNGPVGVFEIEQFSTGTKALSLSIAESKAFSIAGGGETLAAIDAYNIKDKISYISTGGGAFLEFIENKTLPVLDLLSQNESAG